jgi:hypothetical protein
MKDCPRKIKINDKRVSRVRFAKNREFIFLFTFYQFSFNKLHNKYRRNALSSGNMLVKLAVVQVIRALSMRGLFSLVGKN